MQSWHLNHTSSEVRACFLFGRQGWHNQERDTQSCVLIFSSYFFFCHAILFILFRSHERAQSTDIGVEEIYVRRKVIDGKCQILNPIWLLPSILAK